ncbi:hypothetical protein D3H65_22935 [Paraflavitalea soli]|uniref:Uncharacterized protein n=1 Tax=Paraflavitalea soli TaxID=2315862 RepID=A0A3B7MTF5_9BACT|nr:hypothetical protein D3H65_22935 [Paraflavitalea soli]
MNDSIGKSIDSPVIYAKNPEKGLCQRLQISQWSLDFFNNKYTAKQNNTTGGIKIRISIIGEPNKISNGSIFQQSGTDQLKTVKTPGR